MDQSFPENAFIFNKYINAKYIIDLYSADYIMIEETFADVVNEYPSLQESIENAWVSGDIASLKRAVHKIKPLFGFVGLTSIQSQCLHFENACESTPSLAVLTPEFTLLKNSLMLTRSIIEEEKERLALFNSR
jgi:HPt (histidine-containing phosphotransfer) domain-containing protein